MPRILSLLLCVIAASGLRAQTDVQPSSTLCRFPLTASLEFQNFGLPFQNVPAYFTHPGLSVGTEINLNKKATLLQQVNGAFVLNKEMGSSFYLYTQSACRFRIYKPLHGEVKLGLGWQRMGHPTDAFKYVDGQWTQVTGGKSLLIVPIGFSLSCKLKGEPAISPFLTYQILPSVGYDDVLPLSFFNLFQAGVRVHFKSNHND